MTINQTKDAIVGQVLYLGRWVEKKFFRAYVYGKDGLTKLCENFTEFEKSISSGIWFVTKDLAEKAISPAVVKCVLKEMENAIVNEAPSIAKPVVQEIVSQVSEGLMHFMENNEAEKQEKKNDEDQELDTHEVAEKLKTKFEVKKITKKKVRK